MNSLALTANHDPCMPNRPIAFVMSPRGNCSPYLHDFIGVLCLAMVSLAFGLVLNRFRSSSLPFIYQPPVQRFDAELTAIIERPPVRDAPVPVLGLDEFHSAVNGGNALILDARPAALFVQGHVPGAINLARSNFAHDYRRLESVLKKARRQPVIVYCAGGDCRDSRIVADAMLTLGYPDVAIFAPGWAAWSAAGLSVSTDDRE